MAVILTSELFVGNGSNTIFTLSESANTLNVIVIVNGLVQVAEVDYTISGANVVFTTPPINTTDIEVKVIRADDAGYTGSVGYFGSAGPEGNTGFRGSRGDEGYQGSAGFQGSAGPPGGDTGYTGSIGYTGSEGSGYTGSMGLIGRPSVSQTFVANGISTYSTSERVVDPAHIFVVVNGLLQLPYTDYTVNTNSSTVDFITVPPSGSDVEIRYFGEVLGPTGFRGSAGFAGSSGGKGYTGSAGLNGINGTIGFTGSKGDAGAPGPVGAPAISQKIVSNGTSNNVLLQQAVANTNHIFVIVNGLIQLPDTDYYISGDTLYFYNTPPSGSDIELRYFSVGGFRGSTGYTGSTGDKGPAGDPGGDIGYTGSAGAGYSGSRGDTGFAGSKGDLGYSGSVGPRGFRGSVGPVGAPRNVELFIANGSPSFPLTYTAFSELQLLISVNGLLQMPFNDYTLNAEVSVVEFNSNSIPVPNSDVEIRYFSEAGFTGSTGYTGSYGPTGYQGSAGEPAFAEVYMQNAAPPDPIDGTLWWDTDNGILNIYYEDQNTWVGIAKGPKGVRGYSGSLGYTGSYGYTGSQGIPGEAADKGYAGSVGYDGSQGDFGYTGSYGYTGSFGYTGSTSYTGSRGDLGYTGSIGFTGSTGAGYVGSQGIVGYVGSLGYTGSIGFTGSTGAGYVGSQGIIGPLGYSGSRGIIGYAGSIGSLGYTGSKGEPGDPTGYTGSYGYTGSSGTGGGTGLGIRQVFTVDTTEIDTGITAAGSLQVYAGYVLYKIEVDEAAWVRIYPKYSDLVGDLTRNVGQEPGYESGVIAEIVTSQSESIRLTPGVIGFNDDDPVSNNLYIAVTNLTASARSFIVNITAIPLESLE